MDSQDYGGSALEYLRRLSTQAKQIWNIQVPRGFEAAKRKQKRMLPSQIRFGAVSKCIPPNNEGDMVAWGE
jgi:hypothetical protein